MKRIILLIAIFCFPLFANEDKDIIPRTVNFLIFAGILWYLLFSLLKNMHEGRIALISKKLEEAQKKLSAAKLKRDEQHKRLDNIKIKGDELVEKAKLWTKSLDKEMKEELEKQQELLEQAFLEQKEYAQSKLKKEIVCEVIDDLFKDENLELKQEELLGLVMKKVA